MIGFVLIKEIYARQKNIQGLEMSKFTLSNNRLYACDLVVLSLPGKTIAFSSILKFSFVAPALLISKEADLLKVLPYFNLWLFVFRLAIK